MEQIEQRAAIEQLFPGVKLAARGSLARARLWSCELGAARAVSIEDAAERVERRGPMYGSAPVKLLLQTRGEAYVSHAGRSAPLRRGDISVLDGSRPFTLELGQDYGQLLFVVPRDLFARRHAALLKRAGEIWSSADAATAMSFDLLTSMAVHLRRLDSTQRAQVLETLLSLWGALVPANVDDSASARRLSRALIDLDSHLADPDLDAQMLAGLQGISRRRLDALFAESGLSVARLIWERRLERVASDLLDPHKQGFPIIDLALGWGFNSGAHFARTFRRRYGQTPSAFRRGGARDSVVL